jgi:Leucine-rich repeat (LRR) protein
VALVKLEKVDLSSNELAALPPEISNLSNLEDLNLDNNLIVSLPEDVGRIRKLKALSLRHNRLRVSSTVFNATNPQPLPRGLFVDTLLIDLNLHGNAMTNTQLNQFDGFQEFLARRQKVKSKTLTNLDVCGLQ